MNFRDMNPGQCPASVCMPSSHGARRANFLWIENRGGFAVVAPDAGHLLFLEFPRVGSIVVQSATTVMRTLGPSPSS